MKTAMILAAGRGERLKPVTNFVPKAMVKVNNMPVIERHIINLSKASYERILINHSYLGWQIKNHLGDGSKYNLEIIYSAEPCGALETGGGIVQALPYLGKDPFLVVNVDLYSDFKFDQIQLESSTLIHLILVSPEITYAFKDFNLDADNFVTNEPKYTFAGIAVYDPEVFNNYKIGRYSVTPILRNLVKQKKVSGTLYQGLWIDVGCQKGLNLADNYKLSS